MTWTIDAAELPAARATIAAHLQNTPLMPATSIDHSTWLKLENHQVTRSFKVRGALVRMNRLTAEERAKGVVAASAGNHGLGVAYAARVLGIRAEIFVPKSAPAVKCNGIAALGADVKRTEAPGYDATDVIAKERAAETGRVFISPFDDPWVALGNGGTLGAEILERLGGPLTIVAPVGGGGLMSGLVASKTFLRRDVEFIGMQSEACPAMARSLAEGTAILEFAATGPTVAEGLEGGVTASTFETLRDAGVRVHTVTEAAAKEAMDFARHSLGEIIEGSSAVALAWVRSNPPPSGRTRVVVITGGNVDT